MGHDGDTALMLRRRNQWPEKDFQLFSELNNVHLIGDERIWPLLVAVKKYLLDQFLTQMRFHLLPSSVPS